MRAPNFLRHSVVPHKPTFLSVTYFIYNYYYYYYYYYYYSIPFHFCLIGLRVWSYSSLGLCPEVITLAGLLLHYHPTNIKIKAMTGHFIYNNNTKSIIVSQQ